MFKIISRKEVKELLELLTALSWASRAKTCYDYTQARSFNDVCLITANCIITECLIYQTKQNIRNQYRYPYYW